MDISYNLTLVIYYWLQEIKNGRLAILACLGFAAQYAATGTDPITNLSQHLASPFTVNFTSNGTSQNVV